MTEGLYRGGEPFTSFDRVTEICSYSIERGGKFWTVKIPLADLEQYGTDEQARRQHVSSRLAGALDGPPDAKAPTHIPQSLLTTA